MPELLRTIAPEALSALGALLGGLMIGGFFAWKGRRTSPVRSLPEVAVITADLRESLERVELCQREIRHELGELRKEHIEMHGDHEAVRQSVHRIEVATSAILATVRPVARG